MATLVTLVSHKAVHKSKISAWKVCAATSLINSFMQKSMTASFILTYKQ